MKPARQLLVLSGMYQALSLQAAHMAEALVYFGTNNDQFMYYHLMEWARKRDEVCEAVDRLAKFKTRPHQLLWGTSR